MDCPSVHILLVDDDDVFCDLVREVYAADEALARTVTLERLADGQEALDFLSGEQPRPDLLLLDQRMPRMDGTETLRHIRQHPDLRSAIVCMLSSSDQDKLVREAYEAGANFYFVKPYEFEELETQLRKIVEFFSSVAVLPERAVLQRV